MYENGREDKREKRRTRLFAPFFAVLGLLGLLEVELLHQAVVSLGVLLLEVLHVVLSISNHLKETSSRVSVLGVLLQMTCQFFNSLGQNGNLRLRRASIRVVELDCFDYLGFFR